MGNFIGCILPVHCLARNGKVNEHLVSQEKLCIRPAPELIKFIAFDEEALNYLQGLFSRDSAFLQIPFIIRIHILVKTPQRDGMPIGFQMDCQQNHVDGLNRLMEGPGRIQRNIPAYILQLKKFPSACLILFLLCLLFAAVSNTARKHHHGLIALKGRFKKPSFSCIARLSGVQPLKLILYPSHDIG